MEKEQTKLPDFKIRPEFHDLLPALEPTEFKNLEEELNKRGIRDTIKYWIDPETKEKVLIDGHNRLSVAVKHGLTYREEEMPFETADQVKEWIMHSQLARRNLQPAQRNLIVGELYRHRQKMKTAKPDSPGDEKADGEREKIAEEVAKETGVSARTVIRAGKLADAFEQSDDETKREFKEGKITQKTLVKKSKSEKEEITFEEEKEPKYADGEDAVTEWSYNFANQLQGDLTRFKNLIDQRRENSGRPINYYPAASERAINTFDEFFTEASKWLGEMKSQYVCAQCLGSKAGCDECERGYVGASRRKYQVQKQRDDKNYKGSKAPKQ